MTPHSTKPIHRRKLEEEKYYKGNWEIAAEANKEINIDSTLNIHSPTAAQKWNIRIENNCLV